jgi:hypothetical protein
MMFENREDQLKWLIRPGLDYNDLAMVLPAMSGNFSARRVKQTGITYKRGELTQPFI